MGLSNELSYKTQSFSCHLNPHSFFFQSEVLRLYFFVLEPWAVWSFTPQFLPVYLHTNVGALSWPTATSPIQILQPLPCHKSSPPWLPAFTLSTSLDECFFFNSLFVRLPYSLIFWQFWLFSDFKFVVVLLLVLQGGKMYAAIPPSWPKVHNTDFFICIFF